MIKPTHDFSGRVVMVTGAASGIGQSVSEYLAASGATIVGVDRSDTVHQAMASLSSGKHLGIVADLTASDSADSAVEAAVDAFKKVDVLINCAGIVILSKALETSDEAWQRTIDINLTASFRMARAAGKVMLANGYGRIVNLASQASVIGLDEHVAYCASKAALLGMTRVLSLEWAPQGVTVNCISPTVVETPLGKAAWDGAKGDELKSKIPTRRFALPEEVAALVSYLASEAAGMVTGENILIDGGYSSI